jgi:hypothetical protein
MQAAQAASEAVAGRFLPTGGRFRRVPGQAQRLAMMWRAPQEPLPWLAVVSDAKPQPIVRYGHAKEAVDTS